MEACRSVYDHHLEETDVRAGVATLERFARESAEALSLFLDRYGRHEVEGPDRLRKALFPGPRAGSFGLLRDLHALLLMAYEVRVTLTAVTQAAQELRDGRLVEECLRQAGQNHRQIAWLDEQIKHRAGHTLLVPA